MGPEFVGSGPAPVYARTSAALYGVFGIMAVVPHIVMDDAGLDVIGKLMLGEPSRARVMCIYYCKYEAVGRCTEAVMYLFVACFAPQFTFGVLGLITVQIISNMILDRIWPMELDGESLTKNAPGKAQPFVQ